MGFKTAVGRLFVILNSINTIINIVLMVFKQSTWQWNVFLILAVLIISWLSFTIWNRLSDKAFFQPVKFGEANQGQVRKAALGIISFQKAQPFFVHAAPVCDEVFTAYERLWNSGFVHIAGGPGEGKSMLALHVANKSNQERHVPVYQLDTDVLKGGFDSATKEKLLQELRQLPSRERLVSRPSEKIIIVDDAHTIANNRDLRKALKAEVRDGHGRIIWLETEYYEEKTKKTETDESTYAPIRINFRRFYHKLKDEFYESEAPVLMQTLADKLHGLSSAKNAVEKKKRIRDPWWFALVASQGDQWVAKQIDDLSPPDKLVLFLICAYIVVSGEAELSVKQLLEFLDEAEKKFAWLRQYKPKWDAFKSLRLLQGEKRVTSERRIAFIRAYNKSANDKGYIAALHYNIARLCISKCLEDDGYRDDLLNSLQALLIDDYVKCAYLSILRRDLGRYAEQFDRDNEAWLVGFFNHPVLDKLLAYQLVLDGIRRDSTGTFNRIVMALDYASIAESLSRADVSKFTALANFFHALRGSKQKLIDLLLPQRGPLIKKANAVDVFQFTQVGNLIRAFGSHRGKLIDDLDLEAFAARAKEAEIENFHHVAALLRALGEEKNRFLAFWHQSDWERFAERGAAAPIRHFNKLAVLLRSLEEKKDLLLAHFGKEDWKNLADQVRNDQGNFDMFSFLLQSLDYKAEMILNEFDENDWRALAGKITQVKVGQFNQVVTLLRSLRQSQQKVFIHLQPEDWKALAEKTSVLEPGDMQQVAQLLEAIGDQKAKADYVENLNLAKLAKTVYLLDRFEHVQQLSMLLSALPEREKLVKMISAKQDLMARMGALISQYMSFQNSIIQKLLFCFNEDRPLLTQHFDCRQMIDKIYSSPPDKLRFLSGFITYLDEECRKKFRDGVDWLTLLRKLPAERNYLLTAGQCLLNIAAIANGDTTDTNMQAADEYLISQEELWRGQIQAAYEFAIRFPPMYNHVAKFLLGCHSVNPKLAKRLFRRTFSELLVDFWAGPQNHIYIGHLINSLNAVDPPLTEEFLSRLNVRTEIAHSINEHEEFWRLKPSGLRHLIKRIHHAAPDVWGDMQANQIKVDLTDLELEELFREDVDEEELPDEDEMPEEEEE